MSVSVSPRAVGAAPSGEAVGPFQFGVLVLSVAALAAIAADALWALPTEISRLLQWVDLVACAAIFADFVVRFRAAESKGRFMRWGWIDLLACIPVVDALRFGRVLRILRLLRLIRGLAALVRLLRSAALGDRRGGVMMLGLTMFLLVKGAAVGILAVERVPNANIVTAGDAVWWSMTTVTTVGYGDRYPVTPAGRAIAMGLMLAGVGMFGALSGIIASLFLGKPVADSALTAELRSIRAQLDELRGPRGPGPRE